MVVVGGSSETGELLAGRSREGAGIHEQYSVVVVEGTGRWALRLAAAGVLALSTAAMAQDAGRAARLSNLDGQVQLTQGNQVLAAPALVNTPLFEGTRIADGR